jgi:hypothetical protein
MFGRTVSYWIHKAVVPFDFAEDKPKISTYCTF